MKAIWLSIVMMIAAASGISGQPEKDVFSEGPTFTPTGLLEARFVEEIRYVANKEADLYASKIETGDLQGVEYFIDYTAGTAIFEGKPGNGVEAKFNANQPDNWRINCTKDAITDARYCWMRKESLVLQLNGRGQWLVFVGNSPYAGLTVRLRVDKKPALTGNHADGFSGRSAAAVISQLKAGQSVVTRHQTSRYDYHTDTAFDLYGFRQSLAFMEWAINRLK